MTQQEYIKIRIECIQERWAIAEKTIAESTGIRQASNNLFFMLSIINLIITAYFWLMI